MTRRTSEGPRLFRHPGETATEQWFRGGVVDLDGVVWRWRPASLWDAVKHLLFLTDFGFTYHERLTRWEAPP